MALRAVNFAPFQEQLCEMMDDLAKELVVEEGARELSTEERRV